MRTINTILLASLNKGKIREYQELFKEWPQLQFKTISEMIWNVSSLEEAETGQSYYENAFNKGVLAHNASKMPTIGEDSGLEVDALGGKPGVYSHRFATPKNATNSDEANIQKLLQELKGTTKDKRTARFVCTLVFFVEGVVLTTTDYLEGTILENPRGANGFGYDPVFLVKGSNKTLAEMSLQEKNQISHRAKALRKLIAEINDKKIKLVRP